MPGEVLCYEIIFVIIRYIAKYVFCISISHDSLEFIGF